MRFSVSIEMTPEQVEAYATEFGTAAKAADVKADIQEYLLTHVQECPAAEYWVATEVKR